MSRVFAARDVELGRIVVVKVLPPEMAAGVNAERFRREIQLAASLQHPHIVPLLHAGHADDLVYYTMPLIEGESLRARLAREGELPVPEVVRILRDVADALAYAHTRGVVHRDIKPDNVLISGHHAMVTDFGVAKAISEATGRTSLTSMGVALGTPAYMAPEQATADPHVDHRADLYALGALGYEMLTGRPPFVGTSPHQVLAAQVTELPDPVTDHRAAVPPALAALVMRCLEKKPADRWQSAAELHHQFEAMATPTGGMAPTEGPPIISSGTEAAIRRGHPARVATLFALAAVGVLALVYALLQLLGLPDWVLPGAIGLLAVGLPIMVWTGVIERRRALARTTGRAIAPVGLHRWFTWRRALLGGVGAFGTLGVGTAIYMGMRLLGIGPVGTLVASGVLAARDRLVLAEFENHTSDTTLGRSVSEAFRVDLAQSPVVRLLDPSGLADALQRMNRDRATPLDVGMARELAQREGVKAVVRGAIDPVGRGFVLSAELVSAADGAVLVAVRENARDDGAIIEAIDRLSKKLRERIGESLKTIRGSEPLERVTTASLDALRRYSQGVKAFDGGENDRAAALLEEAVALDTGFAMAYRKLAVIGFNTFAAPSRMAAVSTKAFRHRDRLAPLERHLAVANYYTFAEFDRAKAAAAYRAALEVEPDDVSALNNLALLLNEMRQFAEAESLALRATALRLSPPPFGNAIRAQIGLGKLAEAAKTVDRFEQRAAGHPFLLVFRSRLAEARRAYDSAEAYQRARLQGTDLARRANTYFTLAALHLVRGRLAEAEAAGRAYMETSERRGLPGAYLDGAVGLALLNVRYRHATGTGRRTVEAALARRPLTSIAAPDRPYLSLALFYAEAGDVPRAKALLADYAAAVPDAQQRRDAFRRGAAAAVAMAEGRTPDAIAGYRAWYDESGCATCGLFELARAYERAGERDSALAVYQRAVTTPGRDRLLDEAATLGATYKRLGELHAERGDVEQARDYYGRFVELWAHADPELQPLVREVRQRLAGLSAGRGR